MSNIEHAFSQSIDSYKNFLETENEPLIVQSKEWFFIATRDLGEAPTLFPKKTVSATYSTSLFSDECIKQNEFSGNKICVAPSPLQCVIALAQDYLKEGELFLYRTNSFEPAFKSINTAPATEEHYLLRPTKFIKLNKILIDMDIYELIEERLEKNINHFYLLEKYNEIRFYE